MKPKTTTCALLLFLMSSHASAAADRMSVHSQIGEVRTTVQIADGTASFKTAGTSELKVKLKPLDLRAIMAEARKLPSVPRLPASCDRDFIDVQLDDGVQRKTCLWHKTGYAKAYTHFAESLRWLRILSAQ